MYNLWKILLLAIGISSYATAIDIKVVAPLVESVFDRELGGREALIIKAVFAECNINAKYTLNAYGQHLDLYENDASFDAVTTVAEHVTMTGYKSISHIAFQNGVSYIAGDEVVKSFEDMKGMRVVAFGNAKNVLPSMNKYIPSFAAYTEVANYEILNRLLEADRVDAIIADGLLVAFNNLNADGGKRLKIKYKRLFTPTKHVLYFKKLEHKNMFDACFKKLDGAGIIDKINKEFIMKYDPVLIDEYLG